MNFEWWLLHKYGTGGPISKEDLEEWGRLKEAAERKE
jgi:hypothetical protein